MVQKPRKTKAYPRKNQSTNEGQPKIARDPWSLLCDLRLYVQIVLLAKRKGKGKGNEKRQRSRSVRRRRRRGRRRRRSPRLTSFVLIGDIS